MSSTRLLTARAPKGLVSGGNYLVPPETATQISYLCFIFVMFA